MKMRNLIISLFILGILSSCQINPISSESVPEIEKERKAKVLTAFFGLDNALNMKALRLSKQAYKRDGMPLVFSQEIKPETLDASDFEITTADGAKHIPLDATLLPANEAFELRTVLLIGEYGDYPDNPPVSVKIIGDLISRADQNYKGQELEVIPLEEGPILSYAEYFTFTNDYPYVEKGRGCDCPREETNMIITAVWSGGVRALNGEELGDDELEDFIVTLVDGADTLTVNPFKLADLKDNDNNIDLCLKESGIPIYLKVNEHTAIDPNDDKNSQTEIDIISRW